MALCGEPLTECTIADRAAIWSTSEGDENKRPLITSRQNPYGFEGIRKESKYARSVTARGISLDASRDGRENRENNAEVIVRSRRQLHQIANRDQIVNPCDFHNRSAIVILGNGEKGEKKNRI
jgi:hypothetical protein